jgi:ABC-type transport system substrate-binding protein
MSVAADDCSYGGEFKAIEAVDESTVKFTLCYPDPAFLSKVAFGAFSIQDKDYLDEMGGDSAKISEAPNGTGAYTLKEWVRGDHMTFEANPNYWGGRPKLDRIEITYNSDGQVLFEAYKNGELDIISVAPEWLQEI